MTDTMNMQLEAAPGRLTALWTPGAGTGAGETGGGSAEASRTARSRQVLKLDQWPAAVRREVVERLADSPLELYSLLKGRLPDWLAALGLWPDGAELAGQEDAGDAEAMSRVRARLEQEPLTALALRGLPKEELSGAVFALWAEQERFREPGGTAETGQLAAELAKLEKKGAAVSAGEWLAEAAAEGSLHQPGPSFLEVRDRKVPGSPEIPEDAGEEIWTELLPGVPGAAQGLALIRRRAAEEAAKRAGELMK
ncbi:hypothetical protein KIH86_10225 [Paenibacillus sp. HN-1]|uniref:hypothetical protein n=1 Tax=Paenibacillus TaxID=44249 RepID=UPI001CA8DE94|nr:MULTISPECIES: hypothetical protein [Paenibacillus]MBY9079965.1 hypothetical protein [Paenibacillus sp. CGMCC 1.18879]MBY9084607.1 hypothetical protein [Paenibacillus sinensis]